MLSGMDREQEPQRTSADVEVAPPQGEIRDAGVPGGVAEQGAVPAVQQELQQGGERTASEQAYKLTPRDPKSAARDTKKVHEHIRAQAKLRGKTPKVMPATSMLQKRLETKYLAEYLANPNPQTGQGAIDKVGAQLDPSKADPTDSWERGASSWNSQDVPEGLKLLIPNAPTTMGAGTEVMSKENRKELPYLDAPQLVGSPNLETGENADVYGGGKNISQLMHWATGVKGAGNDPEAMRDVFLAYEYFHLEGWDKFGEDSINDMIAEEGGRIMGRQLLAGQINQGNLNGKLNEGFDEARAWVGSLIKHRQGELDAVITSQTVVESKMWWGEIDESVRWWGDSTIYLDLLAGKSTEEVIASQQVEHFIDVYSLIYWAEEWQKKNQKIDNSNFTKGMLDHKYDKVMEKSVKGEELSDQDKIDAYFDAKAPWVPGFLRKPLAGSKLKKEKENKPDEP
jgi:hypothetical protein